jgi:hypothetical protein
MINVCVVREAQSNIDQLWQRLRNFADLSWLEGAEKVETFGAGLGMRRRIYMGDGYVDETLQTIDDEQKTLAYTIDKSAVFPFDNYTGQVTLTSTDAKHVRIDWGCAFESNVMSEEEAKTSLNATYNMLIDALLSSVSD